MPLFLFATPLPDALASEIFGGVLAHDVKTPFTLGGFERGSDLQVGWRGNRMSALSLIGAPSPHVFGSLSTSGDTNFVAAGIGWRIGGDVYVRPGIGLAVHDRRSLTVGEDGFRRDLGSRVLFAPEIGFGYQVTDGFSVEAS
ncbi:MAG TPA: acyloxyacyl hydrolase [Sphingomonadaceae bacterium]|nr:acyloxyacyl hydrolase [Sphingomonadaceae bacterium]